MIDGLALPQKHCPPGHYCLERLGQVILPTSPSRKDRCMPVGYVLHAGVVSSANIIQLPPSASVMQTRVSQVHHTSGHGTVPLVTIVLLEEFAMSEANVLPRGGKAEPKPCLLVNTTLVGQQSCQKCPKVQSVLGSCAKNQNQYAGFVCDEEGLAVAGTHVQLGMLS